ncbi:hypothetical protein GXW82_08985 [Streptacidiphilus sp. 4-A2]|nr:hypothetical protein [Streptacidiphilus sp. 4-A2]
MDWDAVGQQVPVRRIPLPGYPYQSVRHWVETPAARGGAGQAALPGGQDIPPVTEPLSTQSAGTEPVGTAGTWPADGAAQAGQPEAAASPFTTLSWVETPARPARGRRRTFRWWRCSRPTRTAPWSYRRPAAAGMRVTRCSPAAATRRNGSGFRIRPGAAEDFEERMFAPLADRGAQPRVLVHAWTHGTAEPLTSSTVHERLDDSFHSLDAHPAGRPACGAAPGCPRCWAHPGLRDVSGAEAVDPAKAMTHGLVRTIALEDESVVCKLVDIGGGVRPDTLVAELGDWQVPGVVALRGDRRWTRTEQEFHPCPAPGPRCGRAAST